MAVPSKELTAEFSFPEVLEGEEEKPEQELVASLPKRKAVQSESLVRKSLSGCVLCFIGSGVGINLVLAC